jgi:hypothetical protein
VQHGCVQVCGCDMYRGVVSQGCAAVRQSVTPPLPHTPRERVAVRLHGRAPPAVTGHDTHLFVHGVC